MKKQETSSITYNLKRVDKVNLIIMWVLIAIIIQQAFLKATSRGLTVMLLTLPIGVLATIILNLNFNRFIKSLLFGVIPAVAVCAVMLRQEFSLDRHYMLCIATAIIALYFNPKLLVVYGGVINVLIITLFIIAKENFLGSDNTIPHFLSIFFMLNGQIVVLFFLTKWGSNILSNTEKSKAEVQELLDQLQSILMDVNISSEQVAAGTRQLSEGSQLISQGAADQASAVEELTASVAEIASQTRDNAMKANEASELSATAKVNAVRGSERMEELQRAMNDIDESSTNISKIIKAIDDIAFQTNILALNAAVEAARAGVHGKGFAVVAEEVRNLAQRSANAAKETAALIEGSFSKVEAGTIIANDTAAELVGIVNVVEKAAQLVGDIAVSFNAQAAAIMQVNQGIEQVSKVVQTNSATAVEAAAASKVLSGQAELLKDQANRFQLRETAN